MSASNPLVLGKEKEQKLFFLVRKQHPGTAFWVLKKKCPKEPKKVDVNFCVLCHAFMYGND